MRLLRPLAVAGLAFAAASSARVAARGGIQVWDATQRLSPTLWIVATSLAWTALLASFAWAAWAPASRAARAAALVAFLLLAAPLAWGFALGGGALAGVAFALAAGAVVLAAWAASPTRGRSVAAGAYVAAWALVMLVVQLRDGTLWGAGVLTAAGLAAFAAGLVVRPAAGAPRPSPL